MSKKDEGSSQVQQNNNTVNNGDIVAGDKTSNNFFGGSTALRRMSTQLKELYSNDEEYKGFIEKLQKYLTYAENQQTVRGVEDKLKAGKREDLIEQAKELKERFYKKINKHQFSEQAQNLFAHILSQIHSFFNSKVRPLIKASKPPAEIDALIYDELVKRIYDDVGDCGLNIDTEDIRGMLFYLTGNCHLEWE